MKVAVINSPFTSHIGRMAHVFAELQSRGEKIRFWGSGETNILAEKYGIPFKNLPLKNKYLKIMQEALKPEEYFTRVFFPMALDQLPAVLALCEQEKPDLLEANTRVFAGVLASEITGIPLMTHCCSGNSFAQLPEDFYGFCVKGDEPENMKELMLHMGQNFARNTDDWYNKNIAGKYNLKRRENTAGLCSERWALAHTIPELSKKRIAALPEVILTGPIIKEQPVELDFTRYKPYVYLTLGTNPWEKEQIKQRYKEIIKAMPGGYNIVIGLGGLFPGIELSTLSEKVIAFNQAPQIKAIEEAEFVICHGGCQTVHETLYHGKPIIGVPHFAEGKEMINSVEINGAAEAVPLSNINSASMNLGVEKVTSNDFLENAQKLGNEIKQTDGFTNIIDIFEKWRNPGTR